MSFGAEELTWNVFVQLLALALLFASTNRIAFRSSRNLRLVNRVVFFILLTIILYTNNSAPFTPAAIGSDKLSGISVSIAKAAWWLVGSALQKQPGEPSDMFPRCKSPSPPAFVAEEK